MVCSLGTGDKVTAHLKFIYWLENIVEIKIISVMHMQYIIPTTKQISITEYSISQDKVQIG